MRRFATEQELEAAVGEDLGTSGWVTVTQDTIDAFAAATGDRQWIHVDRERARESAFGGTIAHGFLTLSLLPPLRDEIYFLEGTRAIINYGCDRLRFLAPVPSGSRVRLHLALRAAEKTQHGLRVVTAATVELEGARRPACVAEIISLLVPG